MTYQMWPISKADIVITKLILKLKKITLLKQPFIASISDITHINICSVIFKENDIMSSGLLPSPNQNFKVEKTNIWIW